LRIKDLNSFISVQQAFRRTGSGSSVILKVIRRRSKIESAEGQGRDLSLFSIS